MLQHALKYWRVHRRDARGIAVYYLTSANKRVALSSYAGHRAPRQAIYCTAVKELAT